MLELGSDATSVLGGGPYGPRLLTLFQAWKKRVGTADEM